MKKLLLGFTLIELLVVISIIGIMIAVGTNSYQKAVKLSRDSKRKTDLEQIRQGLETYRSEYGFYPDTKEMLQPDYINNLPIDPRGSSYPYTYTKTSATTYQLCAGLELPTYAPCNYTVENP